MWDDLRYAVRALTRRLSFTGVAIAVLALAIGANTAIFSLINVVLFRTPAVPDGEQLLYVYSRFLSQGIVQYGGISHANYLHILDNSENFSGLTARSRDTAVVRGRDERSLLVGEVTSGNYFEVLQVNAARGRTLTPADDDPTAPPVVVISHALWQRRFSGAADAIGATLSLAPDAFASSLPGRLYTIVGVMPESFVGTSNAWTPIDYWIPLRQRAEDYGCYRDRILSNLSAIGRVRPGVPRNQAKAAVAALSAYVPEQSKNEQWSLEGRDGPVSALPFATRMVPARLAAGLIVLSGLVLLIACANLAGMMAARAVTRRNEIAVRLALGAGRWRITRQTLIESVLLALAGGAGGLVVGRMIVVAFVTYLPTRLPNGRVPLSLDVPLDDRVLGFTIGLAIVAAVVVGLWPALQAARQDIRPTFARDMTGSTSTTRSRLRHAIVLPQIATSLALLLVAGVVVRTMLRAELTAPGYNADRVILVEYAFLGSPSCGRRTPAESTAFLEERASLNERLEGRIRELPGVASGALATGIPTEQFFGSIVSQDGLPKGEYQGVRAAFVTPTYFEILKVPIIQGRAFDTRDVKDAPRVAIVSRSLGQRLWPGRSPIGERLAQRDANSTSPPQWLEVVGIAADTHHPLSDGGSAPQYYAPLSQSGSYARFVVARVESNQAEAELAIVKAIREVDSRIDIVWTTSMAEAVDSVRYSRRLAAATLALAGGIGLLLTAVGLYGVMAFAVAQRVHEMGVRAALGADRRDLIHLVVGEGLRVVVSGLLVGFALTFVAVRLTSALVVALPAFDVVTLAVVPFVALSVGALACYFPARRAASVDPMVVLRQL